MKFFAKYTRSDLFMLLLTIFFIIKINFPQKSPIDALGVLVILVWVFLSFFKSITPGPNEKNKF